MPIAKVNKILIPLLIIASQKNIVKSAVFWHRVELSKHVNCVYKGFMDCMNGRYDFKDESAFDIIDCAVAYEEKNSVSH